MDEGTDGSMKKRGREGKRQAGRKRNVSMRRANARNPITIVLLFSLALSLDGSVKR